MWMRRQHLSSHYRIKYYQISSHRRWKRICPRSLSVDLQMSLPLMVRCRKPPCAPSHQLGVGMASVTVPLHLFNQTSFFQGLSISQTTICTTSATLWHSSEYRNSKYGRSWNMQSIVTCIGQILILGTIKSATSHKRTSINKFSRPLASA